MSWKKAAIWANTEAAIRTPRLFEARQRGAPAATNAPCRRDCRDADRGEDLVVRIHV